MKYLVDSNIFIYYLNGDKNIFSFIETNKDKIAISIITFYEVLNFDFKEEEELAVKSFLENFEIINISKKIVELSLSLRKLKKIKMADNFILSTAKLYDLILVTRNIDDFKGFEVEILNPFER